MPLAALDAFDQAIRSWGAQLPFPGEEVLRLLIAAFAGGLVGLERESRGRQAGFRTNLLVCVGSALVMLVSISFAARAWPHDSSFRVQVDPARIAYGIMQGIGILGAGAIIKHGTSVRGLTTAAGLWCVAAVGMAAGFGLYGLTLTSTVIIVLALWLLDYLEAMLPKLRYRTIVVRRDWGPGCIEETIDRFRSAGARVTDASFQRTEDLTQVDVSVRVAFSRKQKYYALQRGLEGDPHYK
jgi:putative Mg2+ transporter-C (MgtC) family protein